jgi:hypothetical protein
VKCITRRNNSNQSVQMAQHTPPRCVSPAVALTSNTPWSTAMHTTDTVDTQRRRANVIRDASNETLLQLRSGDLCSSILLTCKQGDVKGAATEIEDQHVVLTELQASMSNQETRKWLQSVTCSAGVLPRERAHTRLSLPRPVAQYVRKTNKETQDARAHRKR